MNNMIQAKYVYRVDMMESERGWGQDYWTVDFDTEEKAQAYIREVNAENTANSVPDYYIVAQGYKKVLIEA